jgi:signal transduction histidine kinase
MDFALMRGVEEVVSDLFKRLRSDRERSGTGVGRALCQRLAVRDGGRI